MCDNGTQPENRPKREVSKVPEMTQYQLIGKVRDMTGYLINLGMFEEVGKATFTDSEIVVMIRRFKVTESRSQYRITEKGVEQIKFTLTESGGWHRFTETMWAKVEDQVHLRRQTASTFASVQDYRDQRDFELSCYRPGTSRTPLDNAAASDSDKMYRHWKLV